MYMINASVKSNQLSNQFKLQSKTEVFSKEKVDV